MRLLLTSAGIKNASMRKTLVELVGEPIAISRTSMRAREPRGPTRAEWTEQLGPLAP